MLKKLNAQKKEIEKHLEKAVAGIGAGQELDTTVSEGRGDLETIIGIIKDRASDSGFSEADEAEEIIDALKDHYDLGITGRVKGRGEIGEEEIEHDCASHVLHEKYGKGICIPEQHTLVKEGDKHVVTHYDVLFKEGKKVVKDIPVSELKIITESHHGHKRRKK